MDILVGKATLFLFLNILISFDTLLWVSGQAYCPSDCKCPYNRIQCASKNLEKIPADLDMALSNGPNDTYYKHLEMSNNQISSVPPGSFSGAYANQLTLIDMGINLLDQIGKDAFSGLDALKRLILSANQISYIEPGAFKELHNLTELSLDQNKLVDIENGTFAGLAALQKLYLRNNNLSQIKRGQFTGLDSLVYLGLDDNRIKSVERDSFENLVNMETLLLSGNNIASLDADTFARLPALAALDLGRNPWACTCANLYEYQQWLLLSDNRQLYDVECLMPGGNPRMLSAAELYGCRALTIVLPAKNCIREVDSGKRLVLECLVAVGVPEARVQWQLPSSNSTDDDGYKYRQRLNGSVIRAEVTIDSTDPSHGGVYTCWADNTFSQESRRCEVIVNPQSPPPTNATSLATTYVAWALMLTLLVVIVGVVTGWLIRMAKKRRQRQQQQQPQQRRESDLEPGWESYVSDTWNYLKENKSLELNLFPSYTTIDSSLDHNDRTI